MESKEHDRDKRNQELLARKRGFRGCSVNMVVMAGCIKKEMIKQSLNHEARVEINPKVKVESPRKRSPCGATGRVERRRNRWRRCDQSGKERVQIMWAPEARELTLFYFK